jgi:hypothetical protein
VKVKSKIPKKLKLKLWTLDFKSGDLESKALALGFDGKFFKIWILVEIRKFMRNIN